jgi:hypothetical protein
VRITRKCVGSGGGSGIGICVCSLQNGERGRPHARRPRALWGFRTKVASHIHPRSPSGRTLLVLCCYGVKGDMIHNLLYFACRPPAVNLAPSHFQVSRQSERAGSRDR